MFFPQALVILPIYTHVYISTYTYMVYRLWICWVWLIFDFILHLLNMPKTLRKTYFYFKKEYWCTSPINTQLTSWLIVEWWRTQTFKTCLDSSGLLTPQHAGSFLLVIYCSPHLLNLLTPFVRITTGIHEIICPVWLHMRKLWKDLAVLSPKKYHDITMFLSGYVTLEHHVNTTSYKLHLLIIQYDAFIKVWYI